MNVKIPVAFGLWGPCDQKCSYCDQRHDNQLNQDLLEKFDYCCSLFDQSMFPIERYVLGGELTFYPLDYQRKILDIMSKHSSDWVVLTNGYDLNSPLLSKTAIQHYVGRLNPNCVNLYICPTLESFYAALELKRANSGVRLEVRLDDNITKEYLSGNFTRLQEFLPILEKSSITELELESRAFTKERVFCGVCVDVPTLTYYHCLYPEWSKPLETVASSMLPEQHSSLCHIYLNSLLNHKFQVMAKS